MPPPGPDGAVPANKMPDFISVAGSDGGIAGYVAARDLIPGNGVRPSDQVITVFARDLHTIVGHLEPGRGFVPLGTDPLTVPTVPVNEAAQSPRATLTDAHQLTLYVRNQQLAVKWIATLRSGEVEDAQSYGSGLGVGCLAVEPGMRLVVLSGPPQEAGSRSVQSLLTVGSGTTPTVWLDFGETAAAASGQGKPSWWPNDGQPC
jgi:hypothetical protein